MAPATDNREFGILDLDTVDGFEFERICKSILEKLNFGTVERTPDVGDEGRDLIVRTGTGTIIVECKHQPGSSIGRPVIQKLHSAVLSYNSNHGMVMTTGTFSRAALDYAAKLKRMGFQIDLVDRNVLADMCARAGLHLHVNGTDVPVWQYHVCSDDEFRRCVSIHLDNTYVSHPYKPSQLLGEIRRDVSLESAYEIEYGVDAVYTTTVGVIARDQVEDKSFFMSGTDGTTFSSIASEFYNGLSRGTVTPILTAKSTVLRSPFRVDSRSIKEKAKGEIVKRHTKRVTYSGMNNHTYTKVCQPNERQFTITSIRQLYFPSTSATVCILGNLHQTHCLEHSSGRLKLINDPFKVCKICGSIIRKRPHLCNSCRNPYHKRLLFSHGFLCKDCGRTVCRDCTTYIRTFIFKKKYCTECGKKHLPQQASPPPKEERQVIIRKRRIRKNVDS